MSKKNQETVSDDNTFKAYCHFCGSTVGQVCDCTEERVTSIYDCPKCKVNYCDQCSYGKNVDGQSVQFCSRCDSQIDKVM